MCVDNDSLGVIKQYLQEDPILIPNKAKSFLLLFGKKDAKGESLPELYFYIDSKSKFVNNEANVNTASDLCILYNKLITHFITSRGVEAVSAQAFTYNIVVDALASRERLQESLQNPQLDFFCNHGEMATTFSGDRDLIKILSEFRSTQKSISQQQVLAANSLERGGRK